MFVTEAAKEYVAARGGVVFVRVHHNWCCSGSLTLFDVAASPPKDQFDYVAGEADDIEVRFLGGAGGGPNELQIELCGLFRPRLAAYWDGCVSKAWSYFVESKSFNTTVLLILSSPLVVAKQITICRGRSNASWLPGRS